MTIVAPNFVTMEVDLLYILLIYLNIFKYNSFRFYFILDTKDKIMNFVWTKFNKILKILTRVKKNWKKNNEIQFKYLSY